MNRILPTACGSARAAALLSLFFLLTAPVAMSQGASEGLTFAAGTHELACADGSRPQARIDGILRHMFAQDFHFMRIHIRTDVTELADRTPAAVVAMQQARVAAIKRLLPYESEHFSHDMVQFLSSQCKGEGSSISISYHRREIALDSLVVAQILLALRQR